MSAIGGGRFNQRALFVLLLLGGFLALAWITAGEARASDTRAGEPEHQLPRAAAGLVADGAATAVPGEATLDVDAGAAASSSATASVRVPVPGTGESPPARVTVTVRADVRAVVRTVTEPVRGADSVPSTPLPEAGVDVDGVDVLPGRPSLDPPAVKAPRAELPSVPLPPAADAVVGGGAESGTGRDRQGWCAGSGAGCASEEGARHDAGAVADGDAAKPYAVVPRTHAGPPYDAVPCPDAAAALSPRQGPELPQPGTGRGAGLPCPFGVGTGPCPGQAGDQPTPRNHDLLAASATPGPRPPAFVGLKPKDRARPLVQRPHDVVELPG